MTDADIGTIARAMVAPGKGVLAADESSGTMGKRLQGIGVPDSVENRRAYREMLFTTAGAGQYVSGAILYDETIRQKTADGRTFVEALTAENIIPGIKVDTGAKVLAGGRSGETVTEGLDGLRERLAEYYELGARFTKWRAVINIGPDMPSRTSIAANAHALARYAALAQEANMVPIVEPEVLMEGSHDIERCRESERGDAQRRLRPAVRAERSVRRHGAEAEHGGPRQGVFDTGRRRRGRAHDHSHAAPLRARRGAGDRVPVGRAGRRGRDRASERHERAGRAALGVELFLRPGATAVGAEDLGPAMPPTSPRRRRSICTAPT